MSLNSGSGRRQSLGLEAALSRSLAAQERHASRVQSRGRATRYNRSAHSHSTKSIKIEMDKARTAYSCERFFFKINMQTLHG